ncbi:MAG: type II toxin-antitoxin system death-on-curing family toxin [Polynucleobacter sp.]|jgi:death-on-curing protein
MTQFNTLSAIQIIAIHDSIIGAHELQGLAKDKSLDGVLARVHNRLQYGFISDAYDLAACYATFLAKGHCFNDANKRTAATALFLILKSNSISVKFTGVSLGDWIVEVATDKKTEIDLAGWLRSLC